MRLSCSSLLVLLGCNQVYGLEATRASDAAYFDAPIDAPYACPAIGAAPRFSRMFVQALAQPCNQYTVSISGRALARCSFDGAFQIAEGRIGERLERAPGFTAKTAYEAPRLGPDGRRAIVREEFNAFYLFERDDVMWRRGARILLPQSQLPITTISAPTRVGRIVAVTADFVYELADDGNGNFTEIRAQSYAALGLSDLTDQVHVTADGLRLLAGGNVGSGSQLLYADRASLDSGFGPMVAMPEIAFLGNGFMTEDCDRLYFSALGSVFETRPL